MFPLKDPGPRCQGEIHIGTALTAGGSYRTEGPKYQGARCTCPGGAPTRPGWVHQRCIRVQGRSAADPGMAQLMVQVKGSERREMISALRLSLALPPGQFLAGVPAGRPAQARGPGLMV